MAAVPIFAKGTDAGYVADMTERLSQLGAGGNNGGSGSGSSGNINLAGSRWTNPTGGASPNMGDPATISWSIVPDGTQVSTINGGLAPSNLIAFMDGIYGTAAGPVANRPWFNLYKRIYDNWSLQTGLTFVYEPADDGADYSATSRGVTGVRGDVRIGGNNIDGNSGILAFNFFPNGSGNTGFDGDMVIDTNDNFYSQNSNGPNGENRGLINVLSHEAGHGIGLGHVIPVNETKLMEPFVSFNFLGTQYDDLLGAQTLYGDNAEPNDNVATANDLGVLGNGITNFTNRSIDRNNDVDLFKFTIGSAGVISLTVSPDGRQYDVGPQNGNASPSNTFLNKDLAFQIELTDGTVLTRVAAAALGLPEVLTNFDLPGAGTYVVRILGTGAETQPYTMRMTLSGITNNPGQNLQKAPRLLSVAPNSGEILSITRKNVLNESPRELVFRFDGSEDIDQATIARGIRISRSGGDGVFGSAGPLTDVVVSPAFLDFGDNQRIVVARFSQPLPDDYYRIEVFGVDIGSQSIGAVRNVDGVALAPRIAGTDRDTLEFDLELGTKIVAVVPQPVVRNNSGILSQNRNQIEVYFGDSELYNVPVNTGDVSPNPTVVDPQFYNLIVTNDTVSPNDDIVFKPTRISYSPTLRRAVLEFAGPIDTLAGPSGGWTYRLRVGSNDVVASALAPIAPTTQTPATDPAGFLSGANDLGTISSSFSTIISEEVRTVSNLLLNDYPGSGFEPGHRDIQDEIHQGKTPDSVQGTTTVLYSFMDNQSYGVDAAGRALFSSISPEQKQRVREIMEFYSMQLGIDIVEHLGPTVPNDGIKKIVVGDMFPNNGVSGPGGVIGIAELDGELAIMDGAEAWDNSFGYGSNIPGTQGFFETALHEIGHLLGLGHTYDLPGGTIMGSEGRLSSNTPLEQVFPGDADTIHGQNLYRPDNRDVDLYKFVVAPGTKGQLRAETIAERLNDSSTLDTYLTLLRRAADGTLSIVAANNNYFSDDSLVSVNLEPGEYFLSVTGKGNEDNDPTTLNTGSGAVSQGRYQLRVDFKATVASHISEQNSASSVVGSALDGDGDGIAGGNFDFWFRAASPVGVAPANAPRTIFVDKAYNGTTRVGSLTQPFNRIVEATAVARPGDIIRLVGDKRTASLTDDAAYEIGNGGASVGTLRDGATLDVPRGVTLMIDSGAILKFGGSEILVGSNDSTTDRSNSAIQVLGIPGAPVYFTSYNDETLGRDTNPLSTVASKGDWGGIEIRNDFDRSQGRFDREREGVFLNTISNADIRWGGGQVGVGALAQVVSPITLSEARPLIIGNTISRSADSAISADPNSFEETLFTEPRYQSVGLFVPDYSRVGPQIRMNSLSDNSANGLFVRIDTLAGQALETLSVPGRIDDSEITIVLGENLTVEGTPGGPRHEVIGPDVSLLSLTPVAPTSGTGFTAATALEYLVTYIDRFGQESLPSASKTVVVAAGQAARLANLPVATLDYVSRRVWRRENAAGSFKLAAVLNRDDTTYVDNGAVLSGTIQTLGMTEINRAQRDASLVIDPGIVVKSLGGRIEVGISATMMAEGSESKPIVFTSRKDDRYGAGGTFDTNNDGNASVGVPGDWAGIVSRHLGELSIDSALITFGGGNSRVPGGFASFNAVEMHQSTGRIANSVLENNASGTTNRGNTNRDARGVNDGAAIFVLASQPVLINNVIRNNSGADTAAISIDANSLKSESVRDFGRSTGLNQRENVGLGNLGPLVNNNQLGGNSLNGMRVRGAVLTTESVWDDTDIVHILQSEIEVPDFHTYGGLRLQSHVDESLVVKMSNSAGFTALGRPLDIKDRIGGSLQIIGSPGFPVVLTSLSDDSIGAGFDYSGNSLLDTNNDGASVGNPGDWRSVRFEPFSNDRNVNMTYELESDQIADQGVNDFPSDAQDIGALANNLNGGDENLRLGVTLTGTVASPSDVDVYRFVATAGTTVWLDIDQTTSSLDSVVELVDGNGQIIALSDNSMDESANPSLFLTASGLPMDQMASEYRNVFTPQTANSGGVQVDFLGVNPLDAGMRVVLPGVAGSANNYYVRVRSSNVSPDPAKSNRNRLTDPALVRDGITVGEYKLHVRMRQTQEVAGSTVRFADIRFATVGIEALGQPMHSPLLGEVGEANPSETNANPASAINIGNILSNDRGAVSIAGNLAAAGDIDWFNFSITRDSIQSVSPTNGPHQSVIFDIDYADGLGRANTQLWIFQRNTTTGELTLVATANDSNIMDDQPSITRGSDVTDLSRGSLGTRDAYIGPIELPSGNYTVAISNASLTHVATTQTRDPNLTAQFTDVRFEPLDSVQRIFEDRFDRNAPGRPTTNAGPVQAAFSTNAAAMSTAVPNQESIGLPNAVPFNLSDVTMFVATNAGSQSRMQFANALTATKEAEMSRDGVNPINLNTSVGVVDIAVSPAGSAFGLRGPNPGQQVQDSNAGSFFGIDIGDTAGAIPGVSGSGLETYAVFLVPGNPPTTEVRKSRDFTGAEVGDGMEFSAISFSDFFSTDSVAQGQATLWGVASRATVNETPLFDPQFTRNILYRLDPNTGIAINAIPGTPDRTGNGRAAGAGTQKVELGVFETAVGTVTGLATINQEFFGVTDLGELVTLNGTVTTILDPQTNAPIRFTGLTAGPRNVEEGIYSELMFGVTAAGRLYAFDVNGDLQPIFPRGAKFMDGTDLGAVAGIDFSSLDVNLWHASDTDANVAGHGRPTNFNNSRETTTGDLSLRFGFANPNGAFRQAGNWSQIYDITGFRNTYALPGGAMGALESDLIDLSAYSADDQPVLYFNYNLVTANSQQNNDGSAAGDGRAALDSFRVYGAGEDGNWVILGTNNSTNAYNATNPPGTRGYTGAALDEFDVPISGNEDAFGHSQITAELLDGQQWRQARINLGALAGKRDVRIRFEFNTGGDFRTGDELRGGQELTAVPGERLKDGDTFVISGQTFEFDLGLVLNIPSGRSIQTGDQIVIEGVAYTFDNAVGARNIPFAAADSPEQLAAKVTAVLQADGRNVVASTATPNVLNVLGLNAALPANAYDIVGADDNIIIGRPGVAGTNAAVSVTNAMNATQVRDAIRTSLAATLNEVGEETNIDVYRVRGNSIVLHALTIDDNGPLTATTVRNGDFFGGRDGAAVGAYSQAAYLRAGQRTINNPLQGANGTAGVQIDDLVLGFAERGEMITGSDPNATFVNSFGYESVGGPGGRAVTEIETGTYQLEIRTAADYGTNSGGELHLETTLAGPLGRTYDTNDRLTKSFALVFDAASQVADGATFDLSDGFRTARYEFDVTTSAADRRTGVTPGNIAISVRPNSTAVEVARAIRNAINSVTSQSIIKITASTRGDMNNGSGDLTTARSIQIDLNGQASADLLGGVNFSGNGVPLTLVQYGQDSQWGEDLGDGNSIRDQGQLIISSNSISNSSGVGLDIDAAPQFQLGASQFAGERAYPGAVRNLVTLNSANVAPGVVAMNNVIAFNQGGGIRISGDTTNTNGNPPLTIARIVNNTLFGQANGDGISVSEGAVPTILNNIVANFNTGIRLGGAASVSGTVLGGNIYQSNGANTNPFVSESFPISLQPSDPLFIDAANGRFYLAPLSQAIDSSVASLENRSNLEQVKSSVGLPNSPLLAPTFDSNGLQRGDDPAVSTPAGLGQTVFIDRGAIDRIDFAGPLAVLQRPLDNDSHGSDVDPTNTYVRLSSGNYDFFEILIDERQGTGPDPKTITPNTVILTENGRPLTNGVDYTFGFSANSRTIRLTPIAGFWRRDSVYEVTLINKPTMRLDAPVNGLGIVDDSRISLTTASGAQTALEFDTGYVLNVPQTLTLVVPSTGSASTGLVDGQIFTITAGSVTATFEFDTNNSIVAGRRRIPITADQNAQQVRDAILAALASATNSDLDLAVKAVGTDRIHLGSVAGHSVNVGTSRLTFEGIANGIEDGQKFTFTPAGGQPVTFEFNRAGDANIGAGNQVITFLRTDTYTDLVPKIIAAISPSIPKGFAPVQSIGNGGIYVGGKVGDTFDVSLARLALVGAPGVSGSFQLAVPAAGGVAIADASTFSVKTPTSALVTFEFTKDGTVGAGNRGIAIRDTDSANMVANAISAALVSANLGLSPTVSGDKVTPNEARGTVINLLTSGLTLTGVSGGAIAVPIVPNTSFDAAMLATQIAKALQSVGLGVKVFPLGVGTLFVEGLSAISGVNTSSIAPITDMAANRLQANRANSLTQFTILMPEVGVDYGDALERANTGSTSNTLLIDNGVRHGLYPQDVRSLVLGAFADADVDGQPSSAADADDFGSSVTFSAGLPLSLAQNGPARVTTIAPSAALIGRTLVFTDTVANTVTYQFTNGGAVGAGVYAVDITGLVTADDLAARLQSVVLQSILDGAITGIHSVVTGNVLSLGGTNGHRFDLSNSGGFVVRQASGSLMLAVAANVSSLAAGQTLTISDGSSNTVIFQVINSASPAPLDADKYPLTVNLTTVTQASFAQSVANAINSAIGAGRLRLPQATVVGTSVALTNDDEDGVRFDGLFNALTLPVPIVVTSSDAGYVDAWIDWNQDNDFDDDGEQILNTAGVLPGENTFTVSTPVSALSGYTTARFRLSATGGLFTYGLGVGGEVEDHLIEILPGSPPIAGDDAYTIDEDGVLTVAAAGVLANDSDPNGDPIEVFDFDPNTPGVQPLVAPQHGSLSILPDGSFVYTPNPDYFGPDSFVYLASDPRMVSNTPATVSITVNPVNDAPTAVADTISILEDISQVWNGSLFTSNDSKGPANESTQTLTVVGAQLVTPRGNGETLTLNGNVLNYTPPLHYNNLIGGPVLVRLTIRDGGDAGADVLPLTSVSTLTINLIEVNDAPIFTIPQLTQTVSEDPGPRTVTGFATNIAPGPTLALDERGLIVNTAGQSVSFVVRPIDPTRFTATGRPAISANGTLTYELAPDVNSANSGPILVEVIAQDDGPGSPLPNQNQSIPQTFTISVTPVNDAPVFTMSTTTFNTQEDAPQVLIPNFITNLAPGPSTAVDEANQIAGVVAIAQDPTAFASGPFINGSGDLTFQLAPDANSLFKNLNINVVATDNGVPVGQTIRVLTIVATDVNDAPTFTLPNPVLSVVEDNEAFIGSSPTRIPGFATNVRPGPSTALDENAQTLTFIPVSVSNPTLFTQLPTLDSNGELTFVTAPDRSGTSVFVVRLQDNGRAGPPPDTNLGPTATFTITIRPINDAPEFDVPASITVDEDQGVVSASGFATGIRPGPASAVDESAQELTFTVTASNPAAFLVQPTMQVDGTLVFQTAKDINMNSGLSTQVVVSLRDNGLASPAPNRNQSASKTFSIIIRPVNDSPIPDSYTTNGVEDTRLTVQAADVLVNDVAGPADEVAEGQQVRMTQVERTSVNGGTVIPVFNGNRIERFDYIPPVNFVGNDFIRYVVTDNGNYTPGEQSATGTITVTLAPINDPPQFTPGSNVTVLEDAPAYNAAWATNVLAGPASATDELTGPTAQTVSFEVTTSNNAMFSVAPTVGANGNLAFTLAKDANGQVVLTITAVDSGPSSPAPNNNRSAPVSITLTVGAVNDAPGFVVGNDVTVAEDSGAFTGTILTNIVPAEGMNSVPPTGSDESGQTVSIITTNNNTALFAVQPVIDSNGLLKFTPAPDAFGTAVVSVIARDNGPNTSPNVNQSVAKTFSIVITPVNDAPVAVNDRYSTNEDTVLTVAAPGVITNDRDVDLPDDSISVVNFQAVSSLGATVTVGANGSITYDPRSSAQIQALVTNENIADTFTYVLGDRQNAQSAPATVTITVSGINDAPNAIDDSFAVPFGVSELLNVLANDVDVDTPLNPSTVEIGRLASNGVATVQGTGRILYRPNANFRGIDTFTYRVRDSLGLLSNEAVVRVVVNTAPVAAPDSAITLKGTPVVIDVLRNDSDADGTIVASTLSVASGPDTGTAIVENGKIKYTPTAGFVGTATLQYVVADNDGLSSNLGTVSIRVVNSLYQNPAEPLDVNADGFISPIDILIVVNFLNANGASVSTSGLPAPPPYMDVNADNFISPTDILPVINFINSRGNSGAGEGNGEGELVESDLFSQQMVSMSAFSTAPWDQPSWPATATESAVVDLMDDVESYGPMPLAEEGNAAATSLEDYLAAWVSTKQERQTKKSSLDSVFANDEDWLF